MSDRKIIYLNTFSWGSAHEMYNASVLYLCAQLTPQLTCRTSKSNYRALCKTLGEQTPTNITFKPTPIVGGGGKYALLVRYVMGAVLDFVYLLFAAKRAIIVMPFNNLFGLRAINWLNKWLGRRLLICCHGELEAMASSVNRKGLLSQILYRRCRRFFGTRKPRIADNLFFAVLGDSVKSNLSHYVDQDIMEHFVSLDHPYIFSERVVEHKPIRNPLRVGSAGAINRSKGLDKLVTYAKTCKEKGLRVIVSHTGRVFGADTELSKYVNLPDTDGELCRSQYDQRLSELDYILFFYNSDSYKITASGAIMDALAACKPIIALRNDYFEYLFKKFGPFGYLADSIDQMVDITKRVSIGELNAKFDFDSIRARLKPASLIGHFASIIDIVEKQ